MPLSASDLADVNYKILNESDLVKYENGKGNIRYNVADEGVIVGDSGRQYDQAQRDFFKNVGRDVSPKGLIERTKDYLQIECCLVGLDNQLRLIYIAESWYQ